MNVDWKIIAVLGAIVLAITLSIGYFSLESAKIQAEKAVKVEQIEQKEKTERTEERSQFWQKLVPWGKDEEDPS